jgi:hypothetical protein
MSLYTPLLYVSLLSLASRDGFERKRVFDTVSLATIVSIAFSKGSSLSLVILLYLNL